MKKMENYFANNQISASNSSYQKKNYFPERINLTEEENNSL